MTTDYLPQPRDCDHCEAPMPVPSAEDVFKGQQVCPNCHAAQLPALDKAAYMVRLEAQVALLSTNMTHLLRRIEALEKMAG